MSLLKKNKERKTNLRKTVQPDLRLKSWKVQSYLWKYERQRRVRKFEMPCTMQSLKMTDSLLTSAFHTCSCYLLFPTWLLLSVNFCLFYFLAQLSSATFLLQKLYLDLILSACFCLPFLAAWLKTQLLFFSLMYVVISTISILSFLWENLKPCLSTSKYPFCHFLMDQNELLDT